MVTVTDLSSSPMAPTRVGGEADVWPHPPIPVRGYLLRCPRDGPQGALVFTEGPCVGHCSLTSHLKVGRTQRLRDAHLLAHGPTAYQWPSRESDWRLSALCCHTRKLAKGNPCGIAGWPARLCDDSRGLKIPQTQNPSCICWIVL